MAVLALLGDGAAVLLATACWATRLAAGDWSPPFFAGGDAAGGCGRPGVFVGVAAGTTGGAGVALASPRGVVLLPRGVDVPDAGCDPRRCDAGAGAGVSSTTSSAKACFGAGGGVASRESLPLGRFAPTGAESTRREATAEVEVAGFLPADVDASAGFPAGCTFVLVLASLAAGVCRDGRALPAVADGPTRLAVVGPASTGCNVDVDGAVLRLVTPTVRRVVVLISCAVFRPEGGQGKSTKGGESTHTHQAHSRMHDSREANANPA